MTIKVPYVIDIKATEDLISRLNEPSKEHIDIEVSLDTIFIGFSALPALFQVFFTWKRSPNSGRLIILHNGYLTDQVQVDKASINYTLFISSILAWENDIVDHNGNDLKKNIRILNRKLMNHLWGNEINAVKADGSIIIPVIDHIPKAMGLPSILYSNGLLRSEEDFEYISDILIGLATDKHKFLAEYLNGIKTGLNKILYEAFDNTNNWAVQSYTGRALNPSIRGIFGRFHEGDIHEMKEFANTNSLANYFSKIKLKRPLGPEYRNAFLEISIFDSGSGLVQVFSGQPIESLSRKEEYNHLIKCLEKHKTSHKAVGTAYGRGAGLYRIMTVLNGVKAFLMIRTGRMLLYRDFLNVEFHDKANNTYNYSLLDMDTQSAIPRERSFTEGTVISIIIPQVFIQ